MDLHVHFHEALGNKPPKTEDIIRLVKIVKAKGLDGIAITEHEEFRFGHQIIVFRKKAYN